MKNSEIKVMLTKEDKIKFVAKARELGLSITSFVEKIAKEKIIFMDKNALTLIEAFSPVLPQKVKK